MAIDLAHLNVFIELNSVSMNKVYMYVTALVSASYTTVCTVSLVGQR